MKSYLPNRKVALQPPFFRGYVKLWGRSGIFFASPSLTSRRWFRSDLYLDLWGWWSKLSTEMNWHSTWKTMVGILFFFLRWLIFTDYVWGSLISFKRVEIDHQVVNWFCWIFCVPSKVYIDLRQHYALKEKLAAVTTAHCLLRVLERLLSTKKALPHGWQWWLERQCVTVTGRGWTFQDLGQDLVVVFHLWAI